MMVGRERTSERATSGECGLCGKWAEKRYGGEGRYRAMCADCWASELPDEGGSAPEAHPYHMHVGRSWRGTSIENDCPCGKAPCGLVDTERIHPGCTQHALASGKTLRQIHFARDCAAAADASTGDEA